MSVEIPEPHTSITVNKYTDEQITALWQACGGPSWVEEEPRAHNAAGHMLQQAVQTRWLMETHIRDTLHGDRLPWRVSVSEPNAMRPTGTAVICLADPPENSPPTHGFMASTSVAALALAFADWKNNR